MDTRKIQIEVEVNVSVCEICGDEETATHHDFRREWTGGRPGDKFVGASYSFATHGEALVRAGYATETDNKRRCEWRLCQKHLEQVREKIDQFVHALRVKIS